MQTAIENPDPGLLQRVSSLAARRQCSEQQLATDAQAERMDAETRAALVQAERGEVIEGEVVLNWLASWGTDQEKLLTIRSRPDLLTL